MAEIERIDIVKLTINAYELDLIKSALDIAEGQFASMRRDEDAAKLYRELDGK